MSSKKAKATPKERPSTRMWYVGFKSSNLSMPSCGVSQYHPISTKAGAPRNSHASLGHVVRGEEGIELPSESGSDISVGSSAALRIFLAQAGIPRP